MHVKTLILPFLCFLSFLSSSAQASKIGELLRVKWRLEADLESPRIPNESPMYWKQTELSSLSLTRLATWLHTLSDRRLTLNEKHVIDLIFLKLMSMEEDQLPFPKSAFGNLRLLQKARELEGELHRLLYTDPKRASSLSTINESGIWQSIFHHLPEEEVPSKAQVDRRWRKEVHTYQKKKGYPPVLSLKDQGRLELQFKNNNPSLSEGEIHSMVQEYEYLGLRHYRFFALILLRFSQDLERYKDHIPYARFHRSLSNLEPFLLKRSLLSRLVHELMLGKFPSPSTYSKYPEANVELPASNKRQQIIGEYLALARHGNFYAIQTLSWLNALKDRLPMPINEAYFDLATPIKERIQNGVPDVSYFNRWREIFEIQKEKDIVKDYAEAPYSYRAAISRRYRDMNQFELPESDEYLSKRPLDLTPPLFMNRAEQAQFFFRVKKNSTDLHVFSFYLNQEARSYAAQGDIQRAISILENEGHLEIAPTKDSLLLYQLLLLRKSGLSNGDLLEGRDEAVQERMAGDLLKIQFKKPPLPKMLLEAGLFREAFEYDQHLKTTDRDYRPHPKRNVMKYFDNRDYHPLSKLDLLKGFYKGGILKSIERKMKGNDDLSYLDSVLDTEVWWTAALELALNPSDKANQKLFSNDEICFLRLLAETKTDPSIWDLLEGPDDTDIALLSELKEFRSLVKAYRRIRGHKGEEHTRVAQAYLEIGKPDDCLSLLSLKKRPNHVDHELKIQALGLLGHDQSSAIRDRQNYEHTHLLPDLRRAATLYEGDKDYVRAEKALSRVCQLSEKLGDPRLEEDRTNLQRVSDTMISQKSD